MVSEPIDDSFDSNRVETVTVDSYGTLVDPDAAERALAEEIENPEPVSKLWRSKAMTYNMIGNFLNEYKPFYDINRDALQFALEKFGVDITPEQRDDILSVYHELDPYEDVREGIKRITDAGYEVYVVSNGNPEMLESMVQHVGIEHLVSDSISADAIETFKPHADIYRHAAAQTGTPITNIAHAAGPTLDVQGAKSAGMQGVWVKRTEGPWETFGPEPDLTVSTFHEFADVLNE